MARSIKKPSRGGLGGLRWVTAVGFEIHAFLMLWHRWAVSVCLFSDCLFAGLPIRGNVHPGCSFPASNKPCSYGLWLRFGGFPRIESATVCCLCRGAIDPTARYRAYAQIMGGWQGRARVLAPRNLYPFPGLGAARYPEQLSLRGSAFFRASEAFRGRPGRHPGSSALSRLITTPRIFISFTRAISMPQLHSAQVDALSLHWCWSLPSSVRSPATAACSPSALPSHN